MNKKYMVRFVQDPTGLRTPALDIWTPASWAGMTLFNSEEEAYAAGAEDSRFKGDYVMMIIPVYVPWTKEDEQ